MKIILSEKQEQIIKNEIIKEAVSFGFSIEYMKQLSSIKDRYDYCVEFLGEPIGKGSSRVVFQYDDNWVLKLAYNSNGLLQNKQEYKVFKEYECYECFPKLYENISDAEEYKFIITEYVLPATENDFKEILGVDFYTFYTIICNWRFNGIRNGLLTLTFFNYDFRKIKDEFELERMTLKGNKDVWSNLELYLRYEDNIEFGDYTRISSYGIVKRGDETHIVILDAGLTYEVLGRKYIKESIKIHKGEKGKRQSTQGKWQDEIDCPHCGESKAFFSMSISDGNKGRGRIKVTDEEGNEVDSEVQTIALYYCPKCYKFTALNNMA